MIKKILWILFILNALAIGLYPALYFLIDRKFGLLSTKSVALLENISWNIGFYVHILGGGLALLAGWSQFSNKLRTRYLGLHRNLGKLYVIAALLSGGTGFYIAFFATGGVVAATGFMALAVIWVYTTWRAYQHILQGRITEHQQWMLYSYAACFAAVMLRIWLPLLILLLQDFVTAYRIVAWLCWVPNLLVVRLFWAPGLKVEAG